MTPKKPITRYYVKPSRTGRIIAKIVLALIILLLLIGLGFMANLILRSW